MFTRSCCTDLGMEPLQSQLATRLYQCINICGCLIVRKETHLQTVKQKMESANLSKFTVVKCEDLTSMYKQCILASSVYWQRCLDLMNPLEMSTSHAERLILYHQHTYCIYTMMCNHKGMYSWMIKVNQKMKS